MSFSEISLRNFKLHTDSIEFAPSGTQALIGSYELNELTRERAGSLTMFEIISDKIEKTYEIKLPGVLDISWMSSELCLVASSSGEIYIIHSHPSSSLVVHSVINVSGKLLLSIDFQSNKIVTSDEVGNIYLINSLDKSIIETWKAHDYEPWCARFVKNDDNLILTGGDDCMARVWDQRIGFSRAVFNQRHEMGVCSLAGVPLHSHLISTGCFDEKLRLWDLRKSGGSPDETVICRSEGGGVWRHKWSPDGLRVLMACMHAGFAVARVPDLHISSSSIAFYRPTAKLAYGVDWHIAGEESLGRFEALIGACSFYDNCVTFARYRDSNVA
ncbi:hypothetical protein Aperf_G00000065877 [Anoplocephala perfoliata]